MGGPIDHRGWPWRLGAALTIRARPLAWGWEFSLDMSAPWSSSACRSPRISLSLLPGFGYLKATVLDFSSLAKSPELHLTIQGFQPGLPNPGTSSGPTQSSPTPLGLLLFSSASPSPLFGYSPPTSLGSLPCWIPHGSGGAAKSPALPGHRGLGRRSHPSLDTVTGPGMRTLGARGGKMRDVG